MKEDINLQCTFCGRKINREKYYRKMKLRYPKDVIVYLSTGGVFVPVVDWGN